MQKLAGIVIALLIGSGVVWMKYSDKGNSSAEVREAMLAIIASAPDYAEHQPYYQTLLDRHHELLFDEHYKMGGRRSSGSFDAQQYAETLFQAMANDAKREGHEAEAGFLQVMHDSIKAERPFEGV